MTEKPKKGRGLEGWQKAEDRSQKTESWKRQRVRRLEV